MNTFILLMVWVLPLALVLLAGASVSYLIAHGALQRGMRPWKR